MEDRLFRIKIVWRDPATRQEKKEEKPMPISMGRLENNDISMSEPTVSRKHASLRLIDGNVYVIDHSTAGTIVDGYRIHQDQRILQHKSVFKIGSCTFTFRQQPRQTRCHNPNCNRIVNINKQDCPYCGFALAGSVTVPYAAAELLIDAQGGQCNVR